MAKKKKIKAQVGDLFAIPIGNEQWCFGQIVSAVIEAGKEYPHTYIVYDFVGDRDTPLETIRSRSILLLFHPIDIRIEDGDWPIIGHENVPEHINFPEYKQLKQGILMVIGVDRQVKRIATPEDEKTLTTMKSISPAIVEGLLQARFGDGEWDEYYDNLFYRGSSENTSEVL